MSVDWGFTAATFRLLLCDFGGKAILNMSKLQKEGEGGEVKTFYSSYNVHNKTFSYTQQNQFPTVTS